MATLSQLDAAQISKMVYDSATNSFRVVPSYVDTTTLVDIAPGGTNLTSSAINVLPYKVTGIMISWSGLNNTNGSVQFQGSVDGTIYENVGSAVTLGTASGQQGVSLIDEPYKYVHAVYSKGSNTTGTITIKYIQRS